MISLHSICNLHCLKNQRNPLTELIEQTFNRESFIWLVMRNANTTSRYLDDILNINNVYFDNMVSQIYP